MNHKFKEEFKKLNPEQLKEIINACAGQDILQENVAK